MHKTRKALAVMSLEALLSMTHHMPKDDEYKHKLQELQETNLESTVKYMQL